MNRWIFREITLIRYAIQIMLKKKKKINGYIILRATMKGYDYRLYNERKTLFLEINATTNHIATKV